MDAAGAWGVRDGSRRSLQAIDSPGRVAGAGNRGRTEDVQFGNESEQGIPRGDGGLNSRIFRIGTNLALTHFRQFPAE